MLSLRFGFLIKQSICNCLVGGLGIWHCKFERYEELGTFIHLRGFSLVLKI